MEPVRVLNMILRNCMFRVRNSTKHLEIWELTNISTVGVGAAIRRLLVTQTGPAAAACGGLDISVSEQFSVFKYDDTYILLTQRRAQQAGDIYSFISDTPAGPWRNKRLLYITPEQNADPDLFTYNAMAHPQFINKEQELLICYNVNSYDLQKPFMDVNTYRPVFLRVPMDMILK